MRDLVDGGTGVGDAAAVDPAGGSQVGGDRERCGEVDEIAAHAEEQFGPAGDPADGGADGDVVARNKAGAKDAADGIDAGVEATLRPEVETARARVGPGGVDGGEGVVATQDPGGRGRFEARVLKEVGAGSAEDLDVVDEAFTIVEQAEVEAVDAVSGESVVHAAGPLDRGPRGLGRFIRIGPACREGGIGVRIDQFEARTAAVSPFAPRSAVHIADLADGDVDGVDDDLAEIVRGPDFVGFGEADDVTPVPEGAGIASNHGGGGKRGMVGLEAVGIARNHEEPAGLERETGGEVELDSAAEPPPGERSGSGAAMVEFDELILVVLGGRIEEEFVDDDVFVVKGTIGGAGRGDLEAAEGSGAAGQTTG